MNAIGLCNVLTSFVGSASSLDGRVRDVYWRAQHCIVDDRGRDLSAAGVYRPWRTAGVAPRKW